MYICIYTYIYRYIYIHIYIHIYIYIYNKYVCSLLGASGFYGSTGRDVQNLWFWFTVPQKGYAKRGSNRQSPKNHFNITFKQFLSHLKVTNLFLEPLLAYPFCGTVI